MANKSPGKINGRKSPVKDESEAPKSITTAMHLPKETWELLRAAAFCRAQATGGRVSVSKLVAELVEQNRGALEREIKHK
jgi:hypothetical protein